MLMLMKPTQYHKAIIYLPIKKKHSVHVLKKVSKESLLKKKYKKIVFWKSTIGEEKQLI